MSSAVDYNTNFFSPKSAFARDNSILITTMLLVWFISVFGFQIALKVLEEPVAEPIHAQYSEVWPSYSSNTATIEQEKQLSLVSLNLMARYIPLRSDVTLKKIVSATFAKLMNPIAKAEYETQVQEMMAINLQLKDVMAKEIIDQELREKLVLDLSAVRNQLRASLAGLLALPLNDLRAQVIPWATLPLDQLQLSKEEVSGVPALMDKHLIHYRSVLTDTTVLGFPLHYGYTAVFLLTLFVVLCVLYCLIFDKIAKKHGMEKD